MDATNSLKLRCFQHCRKDTDLVCFRLPERCPLCGEDTAMTPCRIPPYILPSPFVSSGAAPRSVVVRPTNGTFISHYSSVCDLHIGLTDGSGRVTEFDERGLTVGSLWSQCLVVLTCPSHQSSQPAARVSPPSIPSDPPDCGPQTWDLALNQLAAAQRQGSLWESDRYNEQTWNCFDLVLFFLTLLKQDHHLAGFDLDLSLGSEDMRAGFCDRFLVQKCRRAGDFVQLYRRVAAEGCISVTRRPKDVVAQH
ncbi:hypothetical protein RRG08_057758 [Elysia crispata]|uniref:MKRN2 opposite strand protein n=1 Tax=Elysia crispata TaxID=231223 RepID=A0AAE0YIG4_9GAST|nr:hypothetical protein RRG08_057758 [Elysia crispata]